MAAIRYVRLTASVGADARTVTVWAVDLGVRNGIQRWSVVDRGGEPKHEVIVGREQSADWKRVQPARMNLTYAELEVVK